LWIIIAPIFIMLFLYWGHLFIPKKFSLRHSLYRYHNYSWFHLLLSILLLLSMLVTTTYRLHIDEWLKSDSASTDLYEKYFVSSKEAGISFPVKRNIILIYMESIEKSYHDATVFGEDLLKEINKLEQENTEFYGIKQIVGADHTAASIFTGLCGYPLHVPLFADTSEWLKNLDSNSDCIPSILAKNGYSTHYLQGSNPAVGNIREIIQYAGVKDFISLDELNKKYNNDLPSEMKGSHWGVSDKAVFELAKKNIVKLAENKQPFFYGISTIDTHYPDGFLNPDYCQKKYDDFSDIILCSDKTISQFINWLKQQSFFKNTTIILIGDHLAMHNDAIRKVKDQQNRSIINIFMNPIPKTTQLFRQFTPVDFTPTILAAAGAKIQKNALGLGRNLFSDESTLLEIMGNNFVQELAKFRFMYLTFLGHKQPPQKSSKNDGAFNSTSHQNLMVQNKALKMTFLKGYEPIFRHPKIEMFFRHRALKQNKW